MADDIDARIDELDRALTHIQNDLIFIKEHIVKSAEVIEKVGVEVMPTINALTENPMVKMLLNKKVKS